MLHQVSWIPASALHAACLDGQHEKSICVAQWANSSFLFSRLWPWEWSCSHGINKPLSVRLGKEGSRASAARSAQERLQIWWNWTSQCEGVVFFVVVGTKEQTNKKLYGFCWNFWIYISMRRSCKVKEGESCVVGLQPVSIFLGLSLIMWSIKDSVGFPDLKETLKRNWELRTLINKCSFSFLKYNHWQLFNWISGQPKDS